MKIGGVISLIVSCLSLQVTSESAIRAKHDEYCDENVHASHSMSDSFKECIIPCI